MDAIETELFRHLLASVCEEMGIVLRRTSFSVNIKERRDYSCAVYDAAGQTAAMGDHMPVHLGAMPESVRHVREAIDLQPGDVAIVNDPFRGGTHLPDITAVSAVFIKSHAKPVFYIANRAHHADVGGMSPGSMPLAQEIYQEGIRIPPTLLVRRGKVDQQLLDLILANVRTTNEREGDLLAQLMAIERGRTRLLHIVKRYGYPRVASNIRGLLDYSERRMRARIAQLPEGEYSFTDYLDSDGVSDKPVRVSATLRIAAARCVLDFSHSDPQAAGPVNANNAVTLSAASYVLRCLLPDDVPFTAGLMRPVEIINPPGRVTNALPPAAMAAGNVETSQRITDVILGAFAQADPKAIPAASSGTMNNISFGGYDPYRSKPFAYYETIAGGMGAGPANNGLSATHTHMTNSLNTPIEAFEHQYPVRITQYRVRRNSGGPGRTRGGDGIVREYEFLTPAEVTILADRRSSGPYGLAGGQPGSAGLTSVREDGNWKPLPGKTRFNVKPGQAVRIQTPGGGGFGQSGPPNSL